jgi:hypothetical protein
MHKKIFLVGTFLTAFAGIMFLIGMIGSSFATDNQGSPGSATYWKYEGEKGAYYAIAAVGLLFSFFGIPILIIGGLLKSKEQTQLTSQQHHISLDRHCPNCGRPIPLDARICPYCKKDFEQK